MHTYENPTRAELFVRGPIVPASPCWRRLRTTSDFSYGGESNRPLSPRTTKRHSSSSVNGRVPGATLELSRSNGNPTPESYYEDTPTEIALNCVAKETFP